MYIVCLEHLDLAIDDFVDEYEEAPDVVDLQEVRFINWDPPATCERCGQAARFLVV